MHAQRKGTLLAMLVVAVAVACCSCSCSIAIAVALFLFFLLTPVGAARAFMDHIKEA